MAEAGKNKIKYNRKWMAVQPNPFAGPPTYIVDTSQTPPVTHSDEEQKNS
jgi:hypothetical protein